MKVIMLIFITFLNLYKFLCSLISN